MSQDIPYYKLLNKSVWWLIPGIKYNSVCKKNIRNPIIIQNKHCIRCCKNINLGFNFKNNICCISCYDFYQNTLKLGNIADYIINREIGNFRKNEF